MTISIQMVIEHEDESETTIVEEVGCLRREDLQLETLGIQLAESKCVLSAIQQVLVHEQVAAYIKEARICPHCGHRRSTKDNKQIVMRTLFGRFQLPSPRLYTCSCKEQSKRSFSPLAKRLPERTTPEFKYLQAKWSSLLSYGLTVDTLEELLPLQCSATTVKRHTREVAQRLEEDMVPEEETWLYGIPMMWDQMPDPEPPVTVGIDGGYVHARDGDCRKAGWFEVIVGKSLPETGQNKRFAFVHLYEEQPRRHLATALNAQGFSMRQSVTFLSDGGDTVRHLQAQVAPYSEHVLDWFHVTMRLTVLRQMARKFTSLEFLSDVVPRLEKIKWLLWHGNVFKALQRLRWMMMDVECHEPGETPHPKRYRKLEKTLSEFYTYIENNAPFIPNYGERYRHGERISTAFAESAVNEIVSRRMVKKQQMRWTQEGAHLLLQVRTKTLDNDLRSAFCGWYPGMAVDGTLNEGVLGAATISC